jgi:hypothetical protein
MGIHIAVSVKIATKDKTKILKRLFNINPPYSNSLSVPSENADLFRSAMDEDEIN